MWMLRILKGPKQGLLFPLAQGTNVVGRSSSCTIKLDTPGVSRKHLEIHIDQTTIRIVDKFSSNGTYINGVKIHDQILNSGDQVAMHNTVFDIIRSPFSQQFPIQQSGLPMQQPSQGLPQVEQNLPENNNVVDMNQNQVPETSPPAPKLHWTQKIHDYIEKVVMPGVYKLPEWIEFKWVIGLFTLAFIFLVVGLSTIPMTRILSSNMEQESMNHAESIAESLVLENQTALAKNLKTALSVDYALRRPGVQKALLIRASDGRIIAPSEKVHEYPKEPFIHQTRKTGKKVTKKINSKTVASMVPIELFNPNTNSQTVMAYSVVLYNTESLSFSSSKVLSLLIQSLFIAILLGCLLFFFLYKVIKFPIESMNEQLNQALKDQTKNVHSNYQFTPLNNLCSNINSTLERVGMAQESNMMAQAPIDRSHEMNNLVELVGFPCLCIQLETKAISAVNSQFEEQIGIPQEKLLYQSVDTIDDVPLRLNLKEAIDKVSQNPSEIHIDQIEFKSYSFQVTAQGVYGSTELAYILVAFICEEES